MFGRALRAEPRDYSTIRGASGLEHLVEAIFIDLSGRKIDDIEERLKTLGIFQYFFPPPDQIALGFTDGNSAPIGTIVSAIELAPAMGHPLAAPELVNGGVDPVGIVEQLVDQGLLVEGEIGYEVTEDGKRQRATVRFRPREGLISKILQRFNVKFEATANLKDLFPR